jgi:hypothetical protein
MGGKKGKKKNCIIINANQLTTSKHKLYNYKWQECKTAQESNSSVQQKQFLLFKTCLLCATRIVDTWTEIKFSP